MYRKFNKKPRLALNTIDENASTKFPGVTNETTAEVTAEVTLESESEDNIPASQEHTQRFLSQHTLAFSNTLARTQSSISRINSSRQPNNYFELVLTKAGVQIDEGDTFVLSCDHMAIVTKLRDTLVRAHNYPENVQTFKTGLAAALAPRLKIAEKLLTGCTIDSSGESQLYQSHHSMYSNFLMIDFLRDPLLTVLLDKIEETAKSEREQLTHSSMPLLPMLLAQLRFLKLSHSEQIYDRMENIFSTCRESARIDIISNYELIFSPSKHDEFTDLLMSKYSNNKDLFQPSIINALITMFVSVSVQEKLHNLILDFIKDDQCPETTVPHLIRLMLSRLNRDTDDMLRRLISTIRDIFNWRYKENSVLSSHDKQVQLELFSVLQESLIRCKRLYQMWQKSLSGLSPDEFKSFDLIMVILLIHIKEENSRYIENILRRRIKLEHITVDILEDVKVKYAHILEQHIGILMYILHDFMREKHQAVSDFAKSAFSILFKACSSIQKNIFKKLLELTCHKSTQNLTTAALQLLCELQRKYPKDVQNCAILLLPLLDRLNDFTLTQTRIAMELLCHVAYPAPSLSECAPLQEQVDMLIKKQLINRIEFVKNQGIIGSVQLIDAMARFEECDSESNNLNASIEATDAFPEGRGKLAADLIILTKSAITHCPKSLALFYDEVASVFGVRFQCQKEKYGLDMTFLMWLCNLTTDQFQHSFITNFEPITVNGIELYNQKCINKLEDTPSHSEALILSMGINISERVLTPSGGARNSIFVLAPLFNCVRVLNLQRHHYSLEAVDALLGCSIVLPSLFEEDNYIAMFDNYDDEQQKSILEICFHTVNWMRVTICAFASQTDQETRSRVLLRLNDLVNVEHRNKLLLAHAPLEFVPPPNQFLLNTVKKLSRGKPKSNKSNTRTKHNETTIVSPTHDKTANQTRLNNVTIKLAACKTIKTKIDFDNLYGPDESYRPLDLDIMLLLDEPFSLNFPLEEAEVGTHLGLPELRFILTDIVQKLDSIMLGQSDKSDHLMQHVAKPAYFINDLGSFLPKIYKILDILANTIWEQLEKVNQVYSNLDLFTDYFNYVKVCFGLCIRLIALYYSWNEWADSAHKKLLRATLDSFLSTEQREKLKEKSTYQIANQVFNVFVKYEKSLVHLSTAVQLQQLLRSLRKLSLAGKDVCDYSEEQMNAIRNLCRNMLNRKWFNYAGCLEKGAQCNIYLDALVKAYLKESSYACLRDILHPLVEECGILNQKDKALKTFPNIKKANFPLLFRALCEVLISTLTVQLASFSGEHLLRFWEATIKLLTLLLDIVQTVEQPRNFVLFLKHSQLFLKLLLQRGMQVLESSLREFPERVGTFLRNLQTVTRFLHQLCCHSKFIKDTSIINYIPQLRETLEALVFRVKAMLVANNCHSVFYMGNLLNKDLHGEAIITPVPSYASAVDSEEEIPDDDASIDETVLGEATAAEATSSNAGSSSGRSKSSSRSKCF